jgi:glycosyltransferase involved in cell wall biosynthesis
VLHACHSACAAEYLLCGLPVITTPSKGGRTEYLDSTNSVTVKPTQAAVRAGVALAIRKLQSREFNRTAIRAGAIARSAAFRLVFVNDLARVLHNHGVLPVKDTVAAGAIFRRRFRHRMFPPLGTFGEEGAES